MPYINNITKKIDKSILVIGPRIMFDNEGKSVVEKFMEEYFKRNRDLIDSFSPHDNLVQPKDETAQGTIQEDFAEFYKTDFPEKVKPLYQKISKIPFPLVVSFNPDTALLSCLEENKMKSHFNFFMKGRKDEINEAPTKEIPYIYNLAGFFDEPQSLILTYEDMYEYLRNIYSSNSIPNKIRSTLNEAKYVIFLGVQFEAWYFQLLIRILTGDYESPENRITSKSSRYAVPDLSRQENIRELYVQNFKIIFVGPQIENFIDELYYKCFEQKLLRNQEGLTIEQVLKPEVFISYSHVRESNDLAEKIVNQLDEQSRNNKYHVVIDKKDLDYKENITYFMDRIGWGKYIIAVIGDNYLRSPFCMYELLEINRKGDLINRLFPVILNYDIFTTSYRAELSKYWENKINEERSHLKDFSSVTDINETVSKIKLYEEIQSTIPEILTTLDKRNFLSVEEHKKQEFSSIFKAIESQKETDIKFL